MDNMIYFKLRQFSSQKCKATDDRRLHSENFAAANKIRLDINREIEYLPLTNE